MNDFFKTNEYKTEASSSARKRICLTLDLKDNEALISKYKWHHARENMWKVIVNGIKQAGIEVMDIYLLDNRMFMICELNIEDDFETCWERMKHKELQPEWAELMAGFQQAVPNHELDWIKMERVFTLYEY